MPTHMKRRGPISLFGPRYAISRTKSVVDIKNAYG